MQQASPNPLLRSHSSSLPIAGLWISALFLLASPLHAIDPTITYVDHSATGSNDGTSWTDAFTSLQDALTAGTPPDEIWVAEGTYYPDEGTSQTNDDRNSTFTLIDDVQIYGGFPNGGSPFADRNPGAHPSTLSGDLAKDDGADFANNAENAYHVLTADGVSASTTLDGFTITAGNATPNTIGSSSQYYGGGLYCSNAAQPSIINCSFLGNKASSGGGIYNTSSSPTITSCSFTGNSATFGGGITNSSSSPTITNCSFAGNSGNAGGGVYSFSSSPTISNCSFSGNSSNYGGGIYNNSSSSLAISNCSISGNSARDLGGGVFNYNSSSPTLANCIIWNNRDNSGTGTAASSVTNGELTTYSHCLVQGLDLTSSGSGNLNGADQGNNPRFFSPLDPTTTPNTSGDLRLLVGSPALDAGDNSANSTTTDLAGDPRFSGTIDLGAYEGAFALHEILSWTEQNPGALDATSISIDLVFGALETLVDPSDFVVTTSGSLAYTGITVTGSGTDYTVTLNGLSGEGSAMVSLAAGNDIISTGGSAPDPGAGSPEFKRLATSTPVHYVNANNVGSAAPPFATPATAATDLQAVLALAAPGDEIRVATGTYTPGSNRTDSFHLLSDVTTSGGYNGDFSSRDPHAFVTILSGEIGDPEDIVDNNYHVVTATGVSANTVLDGFTITGGNANGPDSSTLRGGGLYCSDDAEPTVINCSFTGNSADSNGGAIYIRSSAPSLNNCSFTGNSANDGGAIYNSSSSPTLNNCFFSNNSASSDGGAIYNNSSSPTLTNCSFSGNLAESEGGGIHNRSSSLTLSNSSFLGNLANYGGGICNSNSTITLTNCSLSGNSANDGGGICNSNSPVTLTNCIIWNNRDDSGIGTAKSSVVNDSANPSYSHCLVQGFNPIGTGNLDGTNASNDPRFASPVEPTNAPTTSGDLRLLFDSPVLDIGDDSANSTLTDLAGNARIQNNQIDLGAYEGVTESLTYYVDHTASGNNDGSTWSDAFTSLQDALTAATSPDEIRVAEGTYYPDEGIGQTNNSRTASFVLIGGVKIYGGFANGGSSFVDRNPATHPTILSGDLAKDDGANLSNIGENAYHVLTANSFSNSTILEGFIITAGNANGADSFGNGGGLYCSETAQLTINNCAFTGNSATFGGGMWNFDSSLTLNNCSFSGNSADSGGGMSNDDSSPVINNCTFSGNSAANGGGMFNQASSAPALTNCIIWNNRDDSGIGTADSSAVNDSSNPSYSHCLVQGLNPAGTGNLDGTNAGSNPLFTTPVDPTTAPTNSGDLRLLADSPAFDTGDRTTNATLTDIEGNPRIQNKRIDLGAYERVIETFNYYVDHTATGANDGSSWANAFTTLQDALTAKIQPTQIWVAQGTYYPDEGNGQIDNRRSSTFALVDGVEIYGGFPNGGGTLTDRNPGAHPVILSGDLEQNDGPNFGRNYDNAGPVLTAIGVSASTLLNGFTITAGYNQDGGGGLYCSNAAQPTIKNCSFAGNWAREGGGIFNESSSPTLTNCSLSGNLVESGGGGMFSKSFSSPTLTNCSFSGNLAIKDGGGMSNVDSSPTLTNCIIWNNLTYSGPIDAEESSVYNDDSNPVYSHCLIQGLDLTIIGNGNLDGTDPSNNPLFRSPPNPARAPTSGGDLRLLAGSPALDIGDNSANATLTDLAGNARIQNTQIDLGAYEGVVEPLIYYVDPTATGDNDGSSWANAFTTLQDALTADSQSSQILVAQGTYYPDEGISEPDYDREPTFELLDGVKIYGGFPNGGGTFADRNPLAHPSILSGDLEQNDGPDFGSNRDNVGPVVTANAIGASTVLDGFTITAGYKEDSFTDGGGGLYCSNAANPIITNCIFSGNSTRDDGGAIYNDNSSPTLINCSISGNSARVGGGIYNIDSSPTLINCSISGNSAEFVGGGIYNDYSSLTLTNCIIWNNRDVSGVGTETSSVISDGIITYNHCLVQELDLTDTGNGNLNGADPSNNPAFRSPVDPFKAPTAGGDLRLLAGSPALDIGDSSANPVLTDLAGQSRIQNNRIDLGAYEGVRAPLIYYVDPTATAANDGSSWANAFTTLQAAMTAKISASQIWVAQGTYYPNDGTVQNLNDSRNASFALGNGVKIYGGFPNGGSSFSDRNPGTHPCILSGDLSKNDEPGLVNIEENAYHVVTAYGVGATTTLDGFTITAGNTNGGFGSGSGGGLYGSNAQLNIINCSFSGNSANAGGGMFIDQASSPTLINCTFSGNSAQLGAGMFSESSSPTLTNCTFSGNFANDGGGILNDNSSFALTNCIIWNNRDSSGTGTANSSIRNYGGNPTYSHCLIQGLRPTGLRNWDGRNSGNNPLFNIPVDPTTAPTTSGDLRLDINSRVLNRGDDSANSSTTDLAGNPRFTGPIDLGAYENPDPSRIWRSDFDRDSHTYGIEVATGRNPNTPDSTSIVGFSTEADSVPVLTFPRASTPSADYILKIMRSPDLSPGSFTEIFRITPTTEGADTEGGNLFSTLEDIITFHDQDPPPGSAFYRLEADYVPPTN